MRKLRLKRLAHSKCYPFKVAAIWFQEIEVICWKRAEDWIYDIINSLGADFEIADQRKLLKAQLRLASV